MNERIRRHEVVTREVEIPDGNEVCWHCKGAGLVSKYDEGWHSTLPSANLAAKRECYVCHGRGYIEVA